MYKGTVQRVLLSLNSLNSFAGYLVVVRRDERVFCWIGSHCDDVDREATEEMARKTILRDFRGGDFFDGGTSNAIKTITEGDEERHEDTVPEFIMLLDLLWTTSTFYFSTMQINNRQKALSNSPISVGYIDPATASSNRMRSSSGILSNMSVNDQYRFVETAFAHPDRTGGIHRVTFVPIETDTIAYVNVGDMWEVWVADGVTQDEEDKAVKFVSDKVAALLKLPFNATRTEILKQYIQVTHQGGESYMFKHCFKKFTTFTTSIAPRPISNSALNKKERKAEDAEEDEEKDVLEGVGDDDGADETVVDFYLSQTPSSNPTVIKPKLQADDLSSVTKPIVFVSNLMPTLNLHATGRVREINTSEVTSDMFAIKDVEQVSVTDRKSILTATAKDASSLIGYQVCGQTYLILIYL